MRLKLLGCLFAVLMVAGLWGFAEVAAVPTAQKPLLPSLRGLVPTPVPEL
jgi:hypothetical protein